jgi:ESS family glutamate:Na+ symporter
MRTVEFDLITTLLAAMVVYFAGRALVAWVGVLRRLNVPAPVVGGVLIALLLAVIDGV